MRLLGIAVPRLGTSIPDSTVRWAAYMSRRLPASDLRAPPSSGFPDRDWCPETPLVGIFG